MGVRWAWGVWGRFLFFLGLGVTVLLLGVEKGVVAFGVDWFWESWLRRSVAGVLGPVGRLGMGCVLGRTL